MLNPSKGAIACLLAASAASPASAQDIEDRLLRLTGPPVHLTYPTGSEETPAVQSALAGAIVHDNTCPPTSAGCDWVGLSLCPTDEAVFWGELPSPANGALAGTAASYTIQGFTFGYATVQPSIDVTLRFYEKSAGHCHDILSSTGQLVQVDLFGLPGGNLRPTLVYVDLAALGLAFTLAAEGEGTWDNDFDQDTFGWSFECTNLVDVTTVLVAGRPAACDTGAGTCFPAAPTAGCPNATGLGSHDWLGLVQGGTWAGCFQLGSLYASGYLRLFAAGACGPPPCTNDCPPTCGTLQTNAYVVTGTSNNQPWAWAIASPQFETVGLNVPGVTPVNSPAIDLATAFAASINGKGCTGLTAAAALVGSSAILTITAPGTQPFELCVGPGAGPPSCCVSGGTVCAFNPDIAEYPLSGQDCNGNGVDDLVDAVSGTSPDVDRNGVPDECEGPGVATCFGDACPCGNDDPTAGCANATGRGALLTGTGSASMSADDLVLTATDVPPFKQGLFYMGDTEVLNPFYDGHQCALGNTLRFLCCIQSSGASGTMTLGPGIGGLAGGVISPGETWRFHAWFRDLAGPCGSGGNLTNLYSVSFLP